MCPTPVGRVHTRVATIWLPALLGVIVSVLTVNADWIVLIGVFLLLGVALDAGVYSWLLKYQNPVMTFVLGAAELGLLLALAGLLRLDAPILGAIPFYWAAWLLAIGTKIALLPILSLTYLESAGEFRRTEWSVPAAQVAMPVLATPGETVGAFGPVVASASGVHAAPLDLQPSPSGLHARPAELR